ncbi:hypothetical protein BT93_K0347 [Corymbia citriodora subsp. variegata]|nr:hypothetical protein BT93_K0347 [Corymbia citriodora subsp. variegata]
MQQPGLPRGGVPAGVPDEQGHVRIHLQRARRDGDEEEHDAAGRDPRAAARGGVRVAARHGGAAPPRVEEVRPRHLHVPQAGPRGLLRHPQRPHAQVPPVARRPPPRGDQARVRGGVGHPARVRGNVHDPRPHHRPQDKRGRVPQQAAHGAEPEDDVHDHGPGGGRPAGRVHGRLHRVARVDAGRRGPREVGPAPAGRQGPPERRLGGRQPEPPADGLGPRPLHPPEHHLDPARLQPEARRRPGHGAGGLRAAQGALGVPAEADRGEAAGPPRRARGLLRAPQHLRGEGRGHRTGAEVRDLRRRDGAQEPGPVGRRGARPGPDRSQSAAPRARRHVFSIAVFSVGLDFRAID